MSEIKENYVSSKINYKERESNIELFRIITMFFIVAHHYVVNSGLLNLIYEEPMSFNSLFLLFGGAWGKTGINCFVLITGYFMCKNQISSMKFLKLLGEIYFYKIVFFIFFLVIGYEVFSLQHLIEVILPITEIDKNFTGCYLMFYLTIPFLNILIQNMNEKQHIKLMLLLGFIYIILGTIPTIDVTMNYVTWYIVLYIIASYIQFYPKKIFNNKKIWRGLAGISIVISLLSIVCCVYVGEKFEKQMAFYFISDSNKILAVITAVCVFMYFRNIKIRNNKLINVIATSTFGVLLIHSISDTMRRWLWQDIFNNVGMYSSKWLIVHAIGTVLIIYTICTIIDYVRIRFIERPCLKYIYKHENKVMVYYEHIEKIFSRFKIYND